MDSCNNRLLAHMSIQCTTVFGQTGDDYDACTRAAADYVTWTKTNMTSGPDELDHERTAREWRGVH